jgi:succinate dehydrogenase / fumarate reductase, cytochrome b subunit
MNDEVAGGATASGLARRDLIHFLARRLHSLTGVLPLGVFLVNHLYENYQAVGPGGEARFNGVVEHLQANPVIVWVEIFGIGLPLLYHALYGLFIAGEARYNSRRYAYGANWRFTFQRVTGIVLVGYLAYHVWMTRLQPVVDPQSFAQSQGLITYSYMHGYLTEAHLGIPIWVLYVAGILAACFHFANGLWGFLIHWGVTTGPRAQKISAYACAGLGLLVAALGLNSLYAFVVPPAGL